MEDCLVQMYLYSRDDRGRDDVTNVMTSRRTAENLSKGYIL